MLLSTTSKLQLPKQALALLTHASTVQRRSASTSRMAALNATSPATSAGGKLVTDRKEIDQIVRSAKTVAVLGCKTEQQAGQPAFYVPQYLHTAGLDVIPVPVFYPDVTQILGKQVHRKVKDVPQAIDILDVFRKPSDLMPHLEDILTAENRPKCVWLQSGIRNQEFEQALVDAGFLVVADECLMVVHRAATSSSSL